MDISDGISILSFLFRGGSELPCTDAADTLSKEMGIEAEIVDLRTLRPLDLEPVYESVAKTNRVVVVQEAWPMCGVAAEVAFRVTEDIFDELDAPPARVTAEDVPLPYAHNLEKAALPSPEKVIDAVSDVCYL